MWWCDDKFIFLKSYDKVRKVCPHWNLKKLNSSFKIFKREIFMRKYSFCKIDQIFTKKKFLGGGNIPPTDFLPSPGFERRFSLPLLLPQPHIWSLFYHAHIRIINTCAIMKKGLRMRFLHVGKFSKYYII